MKSSRLEEIHNIKENIFKDIRNLFRSEKLKKQKTNDAAIKGMRNPFGLKKKIKHLNTK